MAALSNEARPKERSRLSCASEKLRTVLSSPALSTFTSGVPPDVEESESAPLPEERSKRTQRGGALWPARTRSRRKALKRPVAPAQFSNTHI